MTNLTQDPNRDQDARFWGTWTDQPLAIVAVDDTPPDDGTEFGDFDPSPTDEREAAFLFGEYATYEEEDRFQKWVDGLHPTRHRLVRNALDTLRDALIDFKADESPSFEEWLNHLAPDNYEDRDCEDVVVIDCKGITD